jgi:hypothetical protein
VTTVNLIAIFLLESLHSFLPEDPNRDEFFYDVGTRN